MIVTKTFIDTMCMYVVLVGFTVAPMLETWFTINESYPHILQAAHVRLPETGCALMEHQERPVPARHRPRLIR